MDLHPSGTGRLLPGAMLLLLLLPAARGHAQDHSALVDELLQAPRLTRQAAVVALLSRPSRPLAPRDIQPLLAPGAPWSAQIAGARISAARRDPALFPLMFQAFLMAKARGLLPEDPDIYRRLLLGIFTLDAEDLAARIREAKFDGLLTVALAEMAVCWQEGARRTKLELPAPLRRDLEPLLEQHTRAWLMARLTEGRRGMNSLRSDAGNTAFALIHELVQLTLAAVVVSGEGPLAAAAAAAAIPCRAERETMTAMGQVLRAAQPPPPAAGMARLHRLIHQQLAGVAPRRLLDPQPLLDHVPQDLRAAPARSSSPMVQGHVPSSPLRLLNAPLLVAALGALLLLLLLLRARVRSPWPLRGAAVVLLLLLLPAAEGALSLVGIKPLAHTRSCLDPRIQDMPLFKRGRAGAPGGARTAGKAGSSRLSELSRAKPPGSLRVFAMGASSVFGLSYLEEEAWPGVLRHRLERTTGGRRVQVFNLGRVGAVSDEIFHWTLEALAYQPDLLIFMLGHNDYANAVRAKQLQRWPAEAWRTRFMSERWSLSTLLHRGNKALREARLYPQDGPSAIASGEVSSRLRPVLTATILQENLIRAAAAARRHGVEVLWLLQGQNERLCRRGTASGAASPEPGCFPPEIHQAVLRAAGWHGDPVVDPIPDLRRAGGGLAGDTIYYDFIHPTALGHAVIGEAVAPAALDILRRRASSPL